MKKSLCILAALAGLNAPAAAPAEAPAGAPGKYLFLVEASADMSDRAELSALAVADLIERGLGGRMRRGDVFTIVPFNEQPDPATYARKVWIPEQSRPISNLAFLYLQKYRFAKKGNLPKAMSLASQTARAERDLVIYLIGSGAEPMAGTPYDAEINEIYRAHAALWKSQKAICVTALVVENGQLTDWAVGAAEPPAPVRLIARKKIEAPAPPPVTNHVASLDPPPAPIVKPPLTATITNTPPPAVTNAIVKPSPREIKPPVVTPPTPPAKPPPEKPPSPNPGTVGPAPVPLPAATNAIAPVTPPQPPPPVQPEIKPVVAATNPPPVVLPIKPPPPQPPEIPPPPVLPPPPSPAPTQAIAALTLASNASPAAIPELSPAPFVAATNSATNRLAIQPLATAGADRLGRPWGMLAAGLGFLALALWLAFVWLRRLRPAAAPSLITQSMERPPRTPPGASSP